MNKANPFLLCFLIICGVQHLNAQSLKGFNYQAVARDNAGAILANTPVTLRFRIHESTAVGTIIYQELHNLTTNQFGLVQAIIGKGTAEAGDFSTIDWIADDYYLAVQLNGNVIDNTVLESVPYAKAATDMNLEDLNDVASISPAAGQILKWSGSSWEPQDLIEYDAGTGIDITGSTISNTAPDQVVQITGSGATSVTGTYPNFEVSSTQIDYTAGSGIDIAVDTIINTAPDQVVQITGSGATSVTGTYPNFEVSSTQIDYAAGTGIDISTDTITNTAPDQVVQITGSGATSVSGTYPSFQVSSTDNVNDADASTSNEIQSLSLSGNNLSLSLGGGSVNLASFAEVWQKSGSNLYYNAGRVGIGDNSPLSTLTVGNGDKFQVRGTDGDTRITDDQGTLQFARTTDPNNAPMIEMFPSGTNNSSRMLFAHSPSFRDWGLMYNDTLDAFTWLGSGDPAMHIELAGNQRIGIGTVNPSAKLHISENSATGAGQLKLTEEGFDFSRITFNNDENTSYWDLAVRTADGAPGNSDLNFFHSEGGNLLSMDARGHVGINDAAPSYALEVNGDGGTRSVNVYNNLPTTTGTTNNYGVISILSHLSNTGFPRLYNIYGSSTDGDSYISYGVYGRADNASSFNYGVYGRAGIADGYAVYASGNTYSTGSYLPSDAKLKSDIRPFREGLAGIMKLQPKMYTYNTRQYESMNLPEGRQYGFLAQDFEQLFPNLTKRSFHTFEESLSDTPEGQGVEFKAINYTALIPIMVSAMQEQQAVIESQEEKIQSLEERLAALEAIIKNK